MLGTLVEIEVVGAESMRAHAAIDRAFQVMESVHRSMSRQSDSSDISRLNRAPLHCVLQVSPHLLAVLREAMKLADISDGAFRPGVCGSGRWDAACIDILQDTLVCKRAEVALDFDGIAKGYAVDCAVELLMAEGMAQGLVNAGGDLRVWGDRAEKAVIRDPEQPEYAAAEVSLCDQALATSAAYDSGQGAVSWNRAASWKGCWSVSVIAPRAIHADALTKIVLGMSTDAAAAIIDQYQAESLILGHLSGIAHAA